MPNPFDDLPGVEIHLVTKAEDVTGLSERDQQLARALDVIRHANAFVLVAVDDDGNKIQMSAANAITEAGMLDLLALAVHYACDEIGRVVRGD